MFNSVFGVSRTKPAGSKKFVKENSRENNDHHVPLGYMKLEPRRVLAVVGVYNGVTGELDITLDANGDTADIGHDGVLVTINGSTDIDPITAGVQTASLATLTEFDVDGSADALTINFNDVFDVLKAPLLSAISVDDVANVVFNGTYELAGNLGISLSGNNGPLSFNNTGTLTVNGSSILNGGTNDLDFVNTGTYGFLGGFTLSNSGATNDISIDDANDVDLDIVTTDGSLTVISGGMISDTATAMITVGGNASFSTTAGGNITLGDQAGDNFVAGDLTFNSTGDVSIFENNSMDITGTNTADNLTLRAVGAMTNAANASITVTSNSNIQSDTSIEIGNAAGDDFQSGTLTFNSPGDVTIFEDDATGIVGINTADNLTLGAVGALTNAANASIVSTDQSDFQSDTSISIGNAANDNFQADSLTFNSPGNVTIFEDDATQIVGINTADNLTLGSLGALADDAAASITVTSNANLQSNVSIIIGDQGGDSFNALSLTFNSAGAVSIQEDSDTSISGVNTADSLALASTGKIEDVAGAKITVTNLAAFNGTKITLGDNGGDTTNFGSLTFNSAGAVSIQEDSSTLIAGVNTADSLALTSTGKIEDAAGAKITITNLAAFSGTKITLGDNGGDTTNFGSLTFSSAGAVSIQEDSDTLIAGVNTADSLALTSTGKIEDAAGAKITVTNLASFAGTEITLGDNGGDTTNFGSLTFNSAGAVSIQEDSNTLIAGVNTADSLTLTSTGKIEDAAGTKITVTNLASLAGTQITLGDNGGDTTNFGSLTFNSAGAVSIQEDSDTLIVGVNTADSLALTSTGKIEDAAGAKITVTNLASFAGTEITLGDIGGDTTNFGSLTFNSAGAVSIQEDSNTLIAGLNTADSLTLTSTGKIEDAAGTKITITNLASLSGTQITLGDSGGDTTNFGSLTFNSAGAVSIQEDSDTLIAGVNTADSLALTSTGKIEDAAGAKITVTNLASFAATEITLGDNGGDTTNFGSLTFNSAGAVSIQEDSDTSIVGLNTSNELFLASTGKIENIAGAAIAVTNTATVSGTEISLGDSVGDSVNLGGLNFNSPGTVTVREDSDSLIRGDNSANSLVLASSGKIEDFDGTKIIVNNLASFNGASITLGDNAGDTTNFGSLIFTSAGAVSIQEDSDTLITGVNTADSLALTSTGKIEDAAGAKITVTNLASFAGTEITLGDNGGDTTNFGSLTFNSAGAVSIQEDSDTLVRADNTANTLSLTSIGKIEDATGTKIIVTDLAAISGTELTLGDDVTDTTNFGRLTFNSSGAVSIQEDSDTLIVGLNTADSLAFISAGKIEDAIGTTITVTKLASFTGTEIVLGDNAGDTTNFGSLTFNSSGTVSIQEDSSTLITGINTAEILNLRSPGAIEDAVGTQINVNKLATFNGATITLGGQAGDVTNFGTLNFTSIGMTTIQEDSSTLIGGENKAASLKLESAAEIFDATGTKITITSAATFSGTQIFLGDNPADVTNFGTLNFNSAGTVRIQEDSDTLIAGANTAGTLNLASTGTINDAANTQLTVGGNATLFGTAIFLGDFAGDTTNFGSLNFNSPGAVAVQEDSSTLITGLNSANMLNLVSSGSIADAEDTKINVVNAAVFAADGTVILADNPDGDALDELTVGGKASFISTTADEIRIGVNKNFDAFDCAKNFGESDSNASVNFGTVFFDSSNAGDTVYGKVAIKEDSTTTIAATSKASSLYFGTESSIFDGFLAGVELDKAPGLTLENLYLETTKSIALAQVGGTSLVVDGITGFKAVDSITIGKAAGGGTVNLNQVLFISEDRTDMNILTRHDAVKIFESDGIELICSSVGKSLVLEAGGSISDAEDSNIVIIQDASFKADGKIVLADDIDGNGTGAGSKTDVLSIGGNASFDGATITVGIDGAKAGSATAGADVNFGSLTFNNLDALSKSQGIVQIQEDSATEIVSNNSAGKLLLVSAGDITDGPDAKIAVLANNVLMLSGDASFETSGKIVLADDSDGDGLGKSSTTDILLIDGIADFKGASISIGQDAADAGSNFKGADVSFGSLTFNAAGDVAIREDRQIDLTQINTANNLILESAGSVFDNNGTITTVQGNLSVQSFGNVGDIALGDGTAKLILDHDSSLPGESAKFGGNNIYLQVDTKINLGETNAAGTLYIETLGANSDIAQVNGKISASQAAFNTTGFLRLNSTNISVIAVESDGASMLNGAAAVNANVDAFSPQDLSGASYGVFVQNTSQMTVGTVVDPQGNGLALTGIKAAQGSIYVETTGGNDLTVIEDIIAADKNQSITLAAGGNFSLANGAELVRGDGMMDGGKVLAVSPLITVTDPNSPASDNFFVDPVTGNSQVEILFGQAGENNFTAFVAWADGTTDNFILGNAQPAVQKALDKVVPFDVLNFLPFNPLFDNTVTLVNDQQINVYSNTDSGVGLTDLNQTSATFTQSTNASPPVTLPAPEIEQPEPVVEVAQRPDLDNRPDFNEPQEFDDIRPAVGQEMQFYSVRADDPDAKFSHGSGKTVEEIKEEIEQNDDRFSFGKYLIFRETPDGKGLQIDEYVKDRNLPEAASNDNGAPNVVIDSVQSKHSPEEQEQRDLAVWQTQWQKWIEHGKFPVVPDNNSDQNPENSPLPELNPDHLPAAAVAVADVPVFDADDSLQPARTSVVQRLATQIASGAMLGGAMMIAERNARRNGNSKSDKNGSTNQHASVQIEPVDSISFSRSARRKRRVLRESN